MQSEIFQDQLWNFSTAYFTSSRYEVASEDMSQFLKDVSETATENDVHIFSQYNEINNKYLSTLHIYGDDKVIRQTLKNTANIEESEYTALVSGITKVKRSILYLSIIFSRFFVSTSHTTYPILS